MYDLINIFDTFLPQLLLYPNPTDPLNNDAASLQLKSEEQYTEKIREYVGLYASSHLSKRVTNEEELKNATGVGAVDDGARQANVTTSMLCDHADQDGDDSSADENKQHESELSETSDIEMLDIDEEDGEDGHAISTTEASKEPTV